MTVFLIVAESTFRDGRMYRYFGTLDADGRIEKTYSKSPYFPDRINANDHPAFRGQRLDDLENIFGAQPVEVKTWTLE